MHRHSAEHTAQQESHARARAPGIHARHEDACVVNRVLCLDGGQHVQQIGDVINGRRIANQQAGAGGRTARRRGVPRTAVEVGQRAAGARAALAWSARCLRDDKRKIELREDATICASVSPSRLIDV